MRDIGAALRAIAARRAAFVSRGDKSGTHAAEISLRQTAGVSLASVRGECCREIGQGMGAALNTAAAMNASVLADRGTWINFRNRSDLDIVVEGELRLFNQYGVILVNPGRHPRIKREEGQRFIGWLTSPAGQKAIANYRINGEQLFFPNARSPGA
jgi:tungstate transport system substrate-binding protein